MSRYLTHIKRLTMVEAGMKRFYEPLEPLTSGEKLGPLLWQFPPNFHRDTERLSGALAALPPGRHAFEFRHDELVHDEVYELLRDHGVALVIGDESSRLDQHAARPDGRLDLHSLPPRQSRRATATTRSPSSRTWARRIAQWRRDTEVYAYFNNDWEGYALRNARLLKSRLGALTPRSATPPFAAEQLAQAAAAAGAELRGALLGRRQLRRHGRVDGRGLTARSAVRATSGASTKRSSPLESSITKPSRIRSR